MINAEPSPVRERFDEGMSVEEFIRRYDAQPFELIEGVIRPLAPQQFDSSDPASLLVEFLNLYKNTGVPIRVYFETPFVLPTADQSNWVKGSRVPDVSVYFQDRLRAWLAQKVGPQPLRLIPDFAAEVVSPTDDISDVAKKAAAYLQDGVRLVWIINPMIRQLTVFAHGTAPIVLTEDDLASGGDVLPGFSVVIKDLFDW